ncbi:MAG TPA: peptidase C45 [Candidatus Latescibacteria bacterium]|nr:peptidase C45 [Candidatus Handelsmanbacteria bacterium]HIL11747.1 peptidase C45 [Candidatus Latescibacterota bacterium]
MSTRYREIEVSGTPRELGRQIGEAARDEVRGFAEIALERVNKTVKISREKALDTCRQSEAYVAAYAPEMLDELRGISDSSGVAFEDLMLLQVRNQLRPEEDAGCTSFAIAPQKSTENHSIVGQNWDNDPALDPFTVVLTRRPTGKPALMNITQAGLIAYIGLNNQGIGVCMNTLPAPSKPLGVPHYFTVREIYEQSSLDAAVQAVRRAQRAIPANIILATPQGPADLEVTTDNVHILRDDQLVVHTNHCLHPDLVAINSDFPDLIESTPRKARIEKLLSPSSSLSIEDMQEALRDHDNHPHSICRHANDHPETGYWVSVFSVVIEADQGKMHISRGNPCETPYETYALN